MAAKKPAKAPKSANRLVSIPAGDPTEEWTVAQIRAYASGRDIDLGKSRRKAELLDLVASATAPGRPEFETVLAATDRSISKATTDKVLDAELQAGPIAALRILAHKIDTEADLRDAALEYYHDNEDAKKAKPPPIDNVSVPTYLKYCESLGLTVATTKAAPKGGQAGGSDEDEKPRSKLVGLRSEYSGT